MNTPSVNPYASPRILAEPVIQGVYFGTRIIRQREERSFDYQRERGVLVPLADQDLKRIVAGGANPPPLGTVNPGTGWIGALSWLVLGLGMFLFFQGPAANQTQWFFRVAILALGVVGVIASTVFGRRSATPGRDDAGSQR